MTVEPGFYIHRYEGRALVRVYGPYAKRSTATSVGCRLRTLFFHLPTTYFRLWHPAWYAEVILS